MLCASGVLMKVKRTMYSTYTFRLWRHFKIYPKVSNWIAVQWLHLIWLHSPPMSGHCMCEEWEQSKQSCSLCNIRQPGTDHIIQTRHEECVKRRGKVRLLWLCSTLWKHGVWQWLNVETSVCTSPQSCHWLDSPLQAVLSLQVGLLFKLHLRTHPPFPIQTNTVCASTSRASDRCTTSQCNELQCIDRRN